MSSDPHPAPEAGAYLFPSTLAEDERLERQGAELYGGTEFLAPFLAGAPCDVLDVGCGSGFFTRQVAAALPSARVVGLDLDDSRIARARAAGAAANTTFVPGEMAALPFAAESFDLCFSRFALVHARDASAALAEMARVVRPGGQVVAYDMVHDGVWFVPDRPAFAEVMHAIVGLLRERGAEPNQGLFLAAGLRRAGLVEVTTRVIPHQTGPGDPHYTASQENWLATVHCLSALLGVRLAADRIQAALAELERVTGEESLVETTVLAWARKPRR